MKKVVALIVFVLSMDITQAQALYFPPNSGTTWDTMAPSSLGWCPSRIDTLYNFLQRKNTAAFIILKDGKIVLEKYYGTFTVDSFHVWHSASKSFTAMLTGIAQEKHLINIDSPVTHYLGAGWTSETPVQEDSITVLNLLTMTSGTNPNPATPCTNEDTAVSCLQYLVHAGTQWAYHTGAYKKIQNVLSITSGKNYDALSQQYVGSTTGMTGAWVNQEFVSIPRSAARFGLLTLNKGIWKGDTLLHDTAYFRAMTNTSQQYNLSYGYLWWLNGKSSYMAPGSQKVYAGSLIPNAPVDMLCALGKNDQKIYVIPSTNMVVVRMGNAADSVADALTAFDNQLWGYIDSLSCTASAVYNVQSTQMLNIYPNPAQDIISVNTTGHNTFKKIVLYNILGIVVAEYPYAKQIDISSLPADIYIIRVADVNGNFVFASRIVKQ